jgi:hypothetical protein
MRKLSPANAQRIIDAACYSWREKLAVLWAKNIVLEKDIEISEDFYKEMRKACTGTIKIIFLKSKKQIV